MPLPRKQNRDEDERPVPHVLTRKSVESEKPGLRKSGTAEAAKFSRLSAQMVELSLQQAQRDPTLHDTFPAKVSAAKPNAVSPPLPLPWPSTPAAPLHPPQPQGTPRESKTPNYWKEVRCNLDHWLAGARSVVRLLFELCVNMRNRRRRSLRYRISGQISGERLGTELPHGGGLPREWPRSRQYWWSA
jgi:hypothetical protein